MAIIQHLKNALSQAQTVAAEQATLIAQMGVELDEKDALLEELRDIPRKYHMHRFACLAGTAAVDDDCAGCAIDALLAKLPPKETTNG